MSITRRTLLINTVPLVLAAAGAEQENGGKRVEDRQGAWVDDSGPTLKIGNGKLEMGFDPARRGALISILDKESGYDMVRDPALARSLFRLAIIRSNDRQIAWIDSLEATKFLHTKKATDRGAMIRFNLAGFPGRKLRVEVEVSLAADSPLSVWRARATGLEAGETVHQFVCPIIGGVLKVGNAAPGECLAVPTGSGEGFLFRNPYAMRDGQPVRCAGGPDKLMPGLGGVHNTYPGSAGMQFMVCYNDRAGLYLACHDAHENVKRFDIGKLGDGPAQPVLSIAHLPSEAPGKAFATSYDTIVGVFHGDWYDGADVYKRWARQQWWCVKKLAERNLPEWFRRGFALYQTSNYHWPEIRLNHSLSAIASTVNGLSREIGVSFVALIFNFERCGAWTGPADQFPPREGEAAFGGAMRSLREAGNRGMTYIPATQWYIKWFHDPPYDSTKVFEREAKPSAQIRDPSGKFATQKDSYDKGYESCLLCPGTRYTLEKVKWLVEETVRRGCPVVQLDVFPRVVECYDPNHGHPVGPGPWSSRASAEILEVSRQAGKAIHPDCVLGSEYISENFIPYIELPDYRSAQVEFFGRWPAGCPAGAEAIPLFRYVYGGYVGAYQGVFCAECNHPETLYWTRSLGKALAHGVVPGGGRYFPEPKQWNPATFGFYKRIARAAAQECWKYIMFGEMLRPPKIDVPEITATYMKWEAKRSTGQRMNPQTKGKVRDAAVQHGVWRASDGDVGYIFANVSQQPVQFEVNLSHPDAAKISCRVELVSDGQRTCLADRLKLPSRQPIRMEPLSVVLIELKSDARQGTGRP